LENLISVNSAITKEWSHIWYWLAFACYKRKDYLKAYDIVQKGLFEFPDHYGLIDIKYVLILKLWKKEKDLIEESIRFLEFRQKLYPKNVENFLELCKIYKSLGQTNNIIDCLKSLLNLSHIDSEKYFLSDNNKQLDKTLRNLKYIDIYSSFREISPLKRYFELIGDDSLIEDSLYEFLWLDFFNSFSEGYRFIENNRKKKNKIDLWTFHSRILNGIKITLRKLVVIIAKSSKPDSIENKIDLMTKLISSPMMIILLEVSGQSGYLGGYFNFSEAQMSELTSDKFVDQSRFMNNFLSKLLESTNKEFQLLKE
ncbi:MAG: hypothetical protein QQN41_09570, partial [Nitrosopumilus sp.]